MADGTEPRQRMITLRVLAEDASANQSLLDIAVTAPEGVVYGPEKVLDMAALKRAIDWHEKLQWQPITLENLPKAGDELLASRPVRVMVIPEGYAPMIPTVEEFTLSGWTHFRPRSPDRK